MILLVDEELKGHLDEIMRNNKTEQEWAEVASRDWFQSANYCGGFDDIEMQFTFSFYDQDGTEYWFQFPLAAVDDALTQPSFAFDTRRASVSLGSKLPFAAGRRQMAF